MQTENMGILHEPVPRLLSSSFQQTEGAGENTTDPSSATITKIGKKWLVENYTNIDDLLIDQTQMNNVVYLYKCLATTLIVRGKINSIIVDSCKKTSVIFDSLIAGIEFINCQSCQMQVLGKVSTISIDKTDGCQMYLNEDSQDVEIITSKSTEMNILLPSAEDGYNEQPVPEQFKTIILTNGDLKTVPNN